MSKNKKLPFSKITSEEKEKEKGKEDNYVHPWWTDTYSFKKYVRGVAPQHLIDTSTRHRIYNSVYWQQHCFGVNLLTLVDRAQSLKGVGGVYGLFREPCNFICLFLKLLELEPSKKVIEGFLNTKSWQMKHLRLLAALYVRFVFPAEEVYLILEGLLGQYFKVAVLREEGFKVEYFDTVIYSFLHDKFWCGITFPPLTPRNNLPPRITPLAHMADKIKEEEFAKLGMNKDGELFEEIEKRKSEEKQSGRIQFKVKKKVPVPAPQKSEADEIAEENKLRAMLGLPLLH